MDAEADSIDDESPERPLIGGVVRHGTAHFTGEGVIAVMFVEPRRAEDRDAGANEMQGPESAEQIASRPQDHEQFTDSRMGAFK